MRTFDATRRTVRTTTQRGFPDQNIGCRTELSKFFSEWFDTAYPTAGGATKPDVTAPGLNGPGFDCKNA